MISKRLRSNWHKLKACCALMLGAGMLLASSDLAAQVKIGNNPTVINSNAVLDVESATKGILFPRLALTATTNPSPLTAHVAGMQVYNTATSSDVDPGIYYNDGTKWVRVGGDVEKVFEYGSGAPSGSCTTGHFYLDTLEESTTEGKTWSCVGGVWVDYNPGPAPATTPFYLARTTVDAGGNKRSSIYRTGAIGVNIIDPKARFHMAGHFLMGRNGYSSAGILNGTHSLGGLFGRYDTGNPTASYFAVQNTGPNANIYLSKKNGTVGDVYLRFYYNATSIGTVTRASASSVSFNTTSDVRLKENIKPTHYGIQDLMKIEVKDYNYIADKKRPTTGFIAQQLYKVFPNAVTVGGKDAKNNPWGVDYAKVTPLLVKAIQDQQKQIEKLNGLQAANEKLTSQNEQLRKELGKVAALNAKLEQMQAQLAQLLTANGKPTVESK